jgi:hypothetical protein
VYVTALVSTAALAASYIPPVRTDLRVAGSTGEPPDAADGRSGYHRQRRIPKHVPLP